MGKERGYEEEEEEWKSTAGVKMNGLLTFGRSTSQVFVVHCVA